MTYTLERSERRGDRTRRKISTPSEAVEKIFENGTVRVVCEKSSTRRVLVRRHGFVEVSDGEVEVSEVEVESAGPESLGYRERVKLAKSLGVEGAHRMKSEALLEAILAAQS